MKWPGILYLWRILLYSKQRYWWWKHTLGNTPELAAITVARITGKFCCAVGQILSAAITTISEETHAISLCVWQTALIFENWTPIATSASCANAERRCSVGGAVGGARHPLWTPRELDGCAASALLPFSACRSHAILQWIRPPVCTTAWDIWVSGRTALNSGSTSAFMAMETKCQRWGKFTCFYFHTSSHCLFLIRFISLPL